MKSIHRIYDSYNSSPILRNICREEIEVMGDNRFYIRDEIDRNITDHIFLVTDIKLDIAHEIKT